MAQLCPHCGSSAKHAVVDSRPDANSIRRRRRCGGCQVRFTTYEVTAFQMRRIEEWDRHRKAIRDLAKFMLARADEIDHAINLVARDRVLMRDMGREEKRRGDGPPSSAGMPTG